MREPPAEKTATSLDSRSGVQLGKDFHPSPQSVKLGSTFHFVLIKFIKPDRNYRDIQATLFTIMEKHHTTHMTENISIIMAATITYYYYNMKTPRRMNAPVG